MFSDCSDLIFYTIFGQSGLNFWDCFRIVRAEFLGLFLKTVRTGFLKLFLGNPGLC